MHEVNKQRFVLTSKGGDKVFSERLRIYLPELLPEVNKVLWLDADAIVVGDIIELMRRAFDEHDVFFADMLIGARDFNDFQRRTGRMWIENRVNHNSHMLVIRKRQQPRTRPYQPGVSAAVTAARNAAAAGAAPAVATEAAATHR